VQPPERTCAAERARGHASLIGGRPDRRRGPVIVGLLVFAFVCGLGVLAALVPVGHGFSPKGGGWFTPDVDGLAIAMLLLFRIGSSIAGGNILDVGQASSLGAWRLLHALHLYGAVWWHGPGGSAGGSAGGRWRKRSCSRTCSTRFPTSPLCRKPTMG
jgi:hypothetical protein